MKRVLFLLILSFFLSSNLKSAGVGWQEGEEPMDVDRAGVVSTSPDSVFLVLKVFGGENYQPAFELFGQHRAAPSCLDGRIELTPDDNTDIWLKFSAREQSLYTHIAFMQKFGDMCCGSFR